MTIRTTSQLESANSLNENDVIQFSKHVGTNGKNNQYSSRKISYKNMLRQMQTQTANEVVQRYSLEQFNGKDTLDRIEAIESQNITLKGEKAFQELPQYAGDNIDDYQNTFNTSFIPKQMIEQMIVDKNSYIGSDSIIHCQPNNDNGYTSYDEVDIESGNMLVWHIDDMKNDSSQFKIDDAGNEAGWVECKTTGNLVVYGWLADYGQVLPQNAWVALYGKVKKDIDGDADYPVILQVQPWVIGTKSQVLQYVGFSIPVKAGLKLKIKTGFPVNGSTSGMNTTTNSLLPATMGTMPNTFIGYIIQN